MTPNIAPPTGLLQLTSRVSVLKGTSETDSGYLQFANSFSTANQKMEWTIQPRAFDGGCLHAVCNNMAWHVLMETWTQLCVSSRPLCLPPPGKQPTINPLQLTGSGAETDGYSWLAVRADVSNAADNTYNQLVIAGRNSAPPNGHLATGELGAFTVGAVLQFLPGSDSPPAISSASWLCMCLISVLAFREASVGSCLCTKLTCYPLCPPPLPLQLYSARSFIKGDGLQTAGFLSFVNNFGTLNQRRQWVLQPRGFDEGGQEVDGYTHLMFKADVSGDTDNTRPQAAIRSRDVDPPAGHVATGELIAALVSDLVCLL